MKRTSKKLFLNMAAFLVAFPLIFTSCEEEKAIPTMDEYEVFKMEFGNFEDELNFFDMAEIGDVKSGMCMRDGFFYISNNQSRKIMGLNSYGDLLTLYFNDETNPRPSFYDEDFTALSTRKAIAYPFNSISEVAVDSRKFIYVADIISNDRQEVDEADGTIYNQMVLRFDANGRYTGYLGQQGFGGTPFPFIKSMYTTDNDDFVVVAKSASGLVVYWFAPDGTLVKKINLAESFDFGIYKNKSSINDVWQVIQGAVPDPDKRQIYIKVDVISSASEGDNHVVGINYQESFIYVMNIDTLAITKSMQVPPYQDQVSTAYAVQTFNMPYELIGITDSGWLFFVVSTDKGFALLMMQSDGQRILRRTINMNRKNSLYYNFCVGNSGILTMLNVKEDYAEICWWRTDSIIQSVIKN